jgi:hypothetical protein
LKEEHKSDFKITFTGDFNTSGAFDTVIEKKGEIFSEDVIDVFQKSDFNVCNLEGPIASFPKKNEKYSSISNHVNSLNYLTEKKINVFNLANNHTADYGYNGIIDTIKKIKQSDGLFFGAGENLLEASAPLYLKNNNITLAIFGISNYSKLMANSDNTGIFTCKYLKILEKRIIEARNKADWIILNYHGGEEYTTFPSPSKRTILQKLSNIQGVDVVICHHSHTFQGIENNNGKLIFYSLGNFVFDYPTHHLYPYTSEGAIVCLNFTKSSYNYSLVPIKTNWLSNQVILNTPQFFKHVKSISDFKNYKTKWANEATRVLFIKAPSETTNSKRMQNQIPIFWFFKSDFYRKLKFIIINPFLRDLYLYAIFNKIFHRPKQIGYTAKDV